MDDFIRLFKTHDEFTGSVNTIIGPNASYCREDMTNYYRPLDITIMCDDDVESETFQCTALARGKKITTNISWSIESGNRYAMITNGGLLTVLNGADHSDVVIGVKYGITRATKACTVTYSEGTEVITDMAVIDNGDGTTTETTTVTRTEADGSSTSESSSATYNEDGELVQTTEQTVQTDSDGSYSSVTQNYDPEGNITERTNEMGDVDGNVMTQEIEYDGSGNSTVVGYDIDTSGNPDGSKEFNADGVNTDYYAFDMTHGFVMNMTFTIDFANQPPNQNENHHQILSVKRADPSPWYGFQLRHSSTNKYIQLGTQFSTGSNVNTTISPSSITGTVATYNITITYDPTATANTFVCHDNITDTIVYSSNRVFPDLAELRYIKVTIGYGLNSQGDSYRYSNINVLNFSIRRLNNVATPLIHCDGRHVTITCETTGATVYYRINQTGSYVVYASAITITADTVVQAYSELNDTRSSIATQTCVYDNGISQPVISCDGQLVTIACETTGATIYYRLNESGNFSQYTAAIPISEDTVVEAYAEVGGERSRTAISSCSYHSFIEAPTISCDGQYVSIVCDTPSVDIYYRINQTGSYTLYSDAFPITADTTVQAYAELNGETSDITTQSCLYVNGVSTPVIACDGEYVEIYCETTGANIYYRLNQTGNYAVYTAPFIITADTTVEAYGRFGQQMSAIAIESCIYNPVHNYSNDYLTFRVLTGGTIAWGSFGSGFAKTIQYSKNHGEWTPITAGPSTSISVAANDVVRFKGTNTTYASSKANYAGFHSGGTAMYDIEGNIMSLVYGDEFVGQTALTGTYNFCSIFKTANVVSAENLVLPATTLTSYCYRAMFSFATTLTKAPELPATTLGQGCYWYMFEQCAITKAPDLLAPSLVRECYGNMFNNCRSLNYIKCLATTNMTASSALTGWVTSVAATGTFVKDGNTTWSNGNNGIPNGWTIFDDEAVSVPEITYDGFSTISVTCDTQGADIYYRLNRTGSYEQYTTAITITSDTFVEAYSELGGQTSITISQNCLYVSDVPLEASNRDLLNWSYNGQNITTPYSVNAIDGHSSSYAKGTFNFETSFSLRQAQPTYLWFQHADQSASIYIDNTLVEKHWGGYTAFYTDISNYVHSGTNVVRVSLKNNEGSNLAPAAGDFNYNATLGNVRLLTSPVLPSMKYGYDGFHVTSVVSDASATITVKTSIPTGATVVCTIDDGTYHNTETKSSTGLEMEFNATITNPHLWNGTDDPHLYTITLEIYYNGNLYHRFQRGYGLRYYSYVIDDTTVLQSGNPYTGFLLNGSPYLLRGVCMHDDLREKANALSSSDYTQEFSIIQELGCNFIRLAHYPHPKEVYDWCDQLGIVVQTEAPCVNKMQSTMPSDYYTHLETQYRDMVNQHYNHPCIMFWGLSNETTTDDKEFAKTKIEGYTSIIKSLDTERMVGYVMSHSYDDPSGYYNNPNVDWFGCNLYVGWYLDQNSNDPTTRLNTRVTKTITNRHKPLAYSEYGCGGTQQCHSDDFMSTTTRGNNARHDIEYQMWLHEGHIAAIRNFPQLMFTGQWQLFDIAVANRNEGYTVCPDGLNASTDDNLRRLNNKGLVERDHVTKKDTFYIYKAEWSSQKFVHICGKDYTKTLGRVIKCYTNDGDTLSMYINNSATPITATVTNHIATFAEQDFNAGDVIVVRGTDTNDTMTFSWT